MFSIIPRDTGFYKLFEEAGEILVRASQTYARLTKDYGQHKEYVDQIRQLEHAGDEVSHRTLDKLDTTFITPFDREDIQALMRQIDDVIDLIDAASKRLALYRIVEPTTWLIKQAEVLLEACQAVGQALAKLRHLKKARALHEHLVEIHRLENVGDDNNHAAVAELYHSGADPILAMKWKEIYDLTEAAIDACEDIANIIQGIVLKNT